VLRPESANILRAMLYFKMPVISMTIAIELDVTLASVNRRTASLHTQNLIGREIRYGRSRGEKLIYLHVTQRGVDALAAYDERRKERPTVAAKNPVARVGKKVVAVKLPRNSIFDN